MCRIIFPFFRLGTLLQAKRDQPCALADDKPDHAVVGRAKRGAYGKRGINELDCLRREVQSKISDFGFEIQDSSNFKMSSLVW